jgi:N-acylglucosamine 2-epimerase
MDHYRRPEKKLLLEYLGMDNQPVATPAGRTVVPGHAIECMWFMIHILRDLGRAQRIPEAVECIHWHIEKGWDAEYGGIFLGMDAEGKQPIYWANWDKKVWWPITEALYALLLCREYTDAAWPQEWYWRVHDYAFSHYPVAGHGEWTQRLDRKGRKITDLIALPVKDPFHLPRALIYVIDVLERLSGRKVTQGRDA